MYNKMIYNMKHTKFLWTLAAFALLGAGVATGCKGRTADTAAEETVEDACMGEDGESEFFDAIETYLVDSIGTRYAQGEMCIPSYDAIAVDESDTAEVRVWGDWWVFNYTLAGDTLKCVAGGSHPGLMHLQQRADHSWEVVAFDQVEDGARNLSSAKCIFGQYYDAFHAVNSNQALRDSTRLAMVADYVKQHGVQAAYLQDYGWPAVEIGQ